MVTPAKPYIGPEVALTYICPHESLLVADIVDFARYLNDGKANSDKMVL